MTDVRIVKVSTSWCGPCRILGPEFEKVSKDPELQDFSFENIDGDEDLDAIERLGITSFPTIVVLNGEEKINAIQGAHPEAKLKQLILEAVA